MRNETAGLLRRVEAGETVVITVRGKAVADLVPHREDAPQWFTPEQVASIAAKHSADPGLRADLNRLAGETTEDLGPIR